MIRAIIVDDETLSANRLRRLLSENGGIEICHAFLDPSEAYAFVKENHIHVAFLDISMPTIDGMMLSGLIKDHDASIDVIFVTAYDYYAVKAFERDAMDYLLKPVTAERLSRTMDKILNKHGSRIAEDPTLNERLTEKETKVIRLIAEGLSNKEVAERLNVTGETVKFHIKNLYRKLGVNNRVQALQRVGELLKTR